MSDPTTGVDFPTTDPRQDEELFAATFGMLIKNQIRGNPEGFFYKAALNGKGIQQSLFGDATGSWFERILLSLMRGTSNKK